VASEQVDVALQAEGVRKFVQGISELQKRFSEMTPLVIRAAHGMADFAKAYEGEDQHGRS
jgi:hypothetical protein